MRLVPLWRTLLGVAALQVFFGAACRPDKSGLGATDGSPVLIPDGGHAGGGGGGGVGGSGASAGSGGGSGGGALDARDATGGSGGASGDADARDAGPQDAGPSPSAVGCADGTREGYLDTDRYPHIAACAGGWQIAGLLDPLTRTATCDRQAGNTGALTDGYGCTVADLCADGWHVCETAAEVEELATNCDDAIVSTTPDFAFFVTRQRAFGFVCSSSNNNGTTNLHGCGNVGTLESLTCAPFTVMLRDVDCTLWPPWSCASSEVREYEAVTKRGSNRGGVLCCKD
jgi:hypothetical protein